MSLQEPGLATAGAGALEGGISAWCGRLVGSGTSCRAWIDRGPAFRDSSWRWWRSWSCSTVSGPGSGKPPGAAARSGHVALGPHPEGPFSLAGTLSGAWNVEELQPGVSLLLKVFG
jgi:hypothetical protein